MSRRLTRVVGVKLSVGATAAARRDGDLFVRRRDLQLKMNDGHGAGNDGDVLGSLRETLAGDADRIVAERHGVELEFAIGIGGDAFRPVRRFGLEHDHGVLNRPMLGIVHDAADRAIDVGEGDGRNKQNGSDQNALEASHGFSLMARYHIVRHGCVRSGRGAH